MIIILFSSMISSAATQVTWFGGLANSFKRSYALFEDNLEMKNMKKHHRKRSRKSFVRVNSAVSTRLNKLGQDRGNWFVVPRWMKEIMVKKK
ncbi:unnamed protein product [Eruca vesicaria subsp. sativa]|uniref:Secreted protein n=1 Tax=Eruca vesicaria subsp. sativa TaxID=29727 RepID=A0ABC8L9P0_ERUVS|nr:unnamed protein product [Eruca vesicaria subsp. sativa]